MNKITVLSSLVILLITTTFFQLPIKNLTTNNFDKILAVASESFGGVSEEPFEELTIPYLRQQNYPGSEIEIYRTWQKKPHYTSYLTSYESEDFNINALLTKPALKQPPNGFPAIVFIHGFVPPETYKTTQKYIDYVDFLAKKGFVVFKIDLRGHGLSGGTPLGAYFSSGYITDTLNAIESLKTLDYVDADNIGLWGHSMAGNIILRSIATNPDIKGASIWAGAVYTYTDFIEYGLNDTSFVPDDSVVGNIFNRSKVIFGQVGEISADNQFWQQVAPINYLDDFKGSIQLHHSEYDPVVSVEYSRNLKEFLDAKNIANEMYEYDSYDHNIGSPDFTQAMQRTVNFFNFVLNK